MVNTIILLLIIIILANTIFNGIMYGKYNELKEKYNNLVKDNETLKTKSNSLFKILPGTAGIIPDYRLTLNRGKDDEHSFSITYEVTILEVSDDLVKVTANNFTSTDRVANDPANKQGIINFLKDKWIERSKVDIVMDNATKRDIKLNDLLT